MSGLAIVIDLPESMATRHDLSPIRPHVFRLPQPYFADTLSV
jgi:hypothetical protein